MEFQQFIETLCCPDCSLPLSFRPVSSPSPPQRLDGHFGLLECGCARYPLIADIPILMHSPIGLLSHWNDGAIHASATPKELAALLDAGNWQESLLRALQFPWRVRGQFHLQRTPLWPAGIARSSGIAYTRNRLSRMLFRQREQLDIDTWLRFFFGRASGNNTNLIDYFGLKTVMPRYLSGMALLQRLHGTEAPVLDVSCGMGHFSRYLTLRERRTASIGLDFNFHQLWAARHLVARDAWFVCADAGRRLPFADGSMAAVTCADAFQFLPQKEFSVAEFERVAPGRPILICRTGHLGVGPANPPSGGELSAPDYVALFGPERSRIFADTMLWKDYLERRDPLAKPSPSFDELRWEKYLSIVVNPQALGPMPATTDQRPHAIGRPRLNPAYRVVSKDLDGIELQFSFGSAWNAYENADMAAYTEQYVHLAPGVLEEAIRQPASAQAHDLYERFVLIGEVGAPLAAAARIAQQSGTRAAAEVASR